MEIIVKRVLRDFKAAEIWRIEIMTREEKWNFKTIHEPTQSIEEAVEIHLSLLEKRKRER